MSNSYSNLFSSDRNQSNPIVLPEPVDDADPLQLDDNLNSDIGGPGQFDIHVDAKYNTGLFEQDTQRLYKTFRIPLQTITHSATPTPVTYQFDFPGPTPDWWVVCLSSLLLSGANPCYIGVSIGQQMTADDVYVIMGGRNTTSGERDRIRAQFRAKSQHLQFSILELAAGTMSSGGCTVDGIIYALTGISPDKVGIF